eukprot:3203226-Alexandrium_andersonii.AAC.1
MQAALAVYACCASPNWVCFASGHRLFRRCHAATCSSGHPPSVVSKLAGRNARLSSPGVRTKHHHHLDFATTAPALGGPDEAGPTPELEPFSSSKVMFSVANAPSDPASRGPNASCASKICS